MIATNLKSDSLYGELWDELIKLAPGDRFLSVREIMKRYSVSQLTVDKAVSRLREDGYLVQAVGKGLFASEQVARFSRTLLPSYLLAVPQWVSTDIDVLERTVEEQRKHFPAYRLAIHRFDVSTAVPRQLPWREEDVAGLVILPAGGDMTVDDIRFLASLTMPAVMLGRHLEGFGIPSVGTDDVFAGNLAAHSLAQRGHRDIAIFLSEPHNRVIMSRVRGILNYARLHRLNVQVIDCEVISGEVAVNKAYRKFCQVIDEGFSFTAMIGVSGESMQGAVNACLNRKIAIPGRLSMISIGAEELTETFHPPLTTVATHFAAQVAKALALLDRKVQDAAGDGSVSYVPSEIVERGSINNI